jgi:adenylate kinase family enzyme
MPPFPYHRINIVGAAGSGTSTLGYALAERLAFAFADADDFYWRATTPPYQHKCPPDIRLSSLMTSMAAQPACVVAGSIAGWGQSLEDAFDLVVFLSLPTALRLERIEAREIARFGAANPAFLAWAGQYEEGDMAGRSRARHEAWLATRRCRVLRFEGDQALDDRVDTLIAQAAAAPI